MKLKVPLIIIFVAVSTCGIKGSPLPPDKNKNYLSSVTKNELKKVN